MQKMLEKILVNILKKMLDTAVGRVERWLNADLDGNGIIGNETEEDDQ